MRTKIVHPVVRELRSPGFILAINDTAEVLPQREAVEIVLRIVEAETSLEHRPVLLHAEKDVGQAGISGGTAAKRLPFLVEAAKRTGADDLFHELRAGGVRAVALEHAGFVVVGLRRKERVLRSHLERLVVALQFVVAHDLVHHVAVAGLREVGGPLDAQALAFGLELVTLRNDLRILHARVVGIVEGDFEFSKRALHVCGLLLDRCDLLLAVGIVHPRLEALVHRHFNLVDRLFGLVDLLLLEFEFAVDGVVDAALERQERGASYARKVEGETRDLRKRLDAGFGQRVLELLERLKRRLDGFGILLARGDVVLDFLLGGFLDVAHLRRVVERGQFIDETLELLVGGKKLVRLHVDLRELRRVAVESDLRFALGLALAVEVLRLRRETVLAHVVAGDPRRVRPRGHAEAVADLSVQEVAVGGDDRYGKRVVRRADAGVLAPRINVGSDLAELILVPGHGTDDYVAEEPVVGERLVTLCLEDTGHVRGYERVVVHRHVDVATVRTVSGLDATVLSVDSAGTVKIVRLDIVVVVDVGTGVSLRIGLAGTDVVIVRIAVDFDQAALDGGLFVRNHVLEVGRRILVAQAVCDALDAVEDVLRHLRGAAGALHDLLEVRFAGVDFARRNVEWNGAVGKSERIESGVGIVCRGLDLARACGDCADFVRRFAVEHADKAEFVGRAARQERVRHSPIVVRAEMRPCGPFVGAPSTAARIAFIIFPFRLVLGVEPCILHAGGVVPAERIGDDLLACACLGLCSLGEALLVEVADRDFGLAGEDALDLRLPAEVRMPEERIVALHCGEVVAPRIAVALRIELLGVIDVDDAVRLRRILGVGCAALVPDAVVLDVSHLAAHDIGGEVPRQTVVERRLPRKDRALPALGVLRRHVASAQETELLLEQVLALVHEREHGAFGGIVHASLRAEVDRRVERVGHSLVSESGVEFRDAARRHLERKRQRLGRHIVVVDREFLGLVENGLVDRDETTLGQRLHVQRNVAVVRLARLLKDRKLGVDLVVEEVADLLVEGIDRLQHALDPALGELGRAPVGPLRADERLDGGIERTVAAPDVVVGKPEYAGIANGDPVEHRDSCLAAASRKREPRAFLVHARCGTALRLAVLPLELPVLRTSAEVGGVLHVDLLVERVVALHHMQEAVVEFGLDLDDGHRDDVAGCNHVAVCGVVEDERHVPRAASRRRQGHLVERRHVVGKHVRFTTHGLDALHPILVLRTGEQVGIEHHGLRPLVHHVEERERIVAVGNVLARQLEFARIVVRPVVERRRIPLEAVAEKRR